MVGEREGLGRAMGLGIETADALWEGQTQCWRLECGQTHGQTQVKSVYPPVSLHSLGRYKNLKDRSKTECPTQPAWLLGRHKQEIFEQVTELTEMCRNKLIKSLTERVLAGLTCSNALVNLIGYTLDHCHQLICQSHS